MFWMFRTHLCWRNWDGPTCGCQSFTQCHGRREFTAPKLLGLGLSFASNLLFPYIRNWNGLGHLISGFDGLGSAPLHSRFPTMWSIHQWIWLMLPDELGARWRVSLAQRMRKLWKCSSMNSENTQSLDSLIYCWVNYITIQMVIPMSRSKWQWIKLHN